MAKWEDAYEPGETPEERPQFGPSNDPAIENEPHMRGHEYEMDPSEARAGFELDPLGATPTQEDQLEASVWDEPGLSAKEFGVAPSAESLTYDRWLAHGERKTSEAKSWWLCLIVACVSGPAAVIGTFLSQSGSAPAIVMICLVGPLAEEVMKAAAILWVVEKRPFFFKSVSQIMICGVMSGLVFAAIENVLYLNVYIPNASPGLAAWRWSVCVALHVGCTCISAYGLSRVWKKTTIQRTRPEIALASTFIIASVLTHAAYNTAATIASGFSQTF